MDWTVYLLSICDNFHAVRFAAMCTMIPCAVGWCISRGIAGDMREQEATEASKRVADRFFRVGIAAALIAATASCFPTQKTITRAYLMVEGSKVVNAPNAEKAMDGFTKRVDRLIKAIEKK